MKFPRLLAVKMAASVVVVLVVLATHPHGSGAYTLRQVGPDTGWQAVAAGEAHTLALRTDGTLWAWGNNAAGQLGNTTNQYEPSEPYPIGMEADWQTVTAGGAHALGLRNDGTLWAWGWNERGQLGLGTYFDVNVPTQVGNAKWKFVSAGNDHTAAIQTDGTLWAWGWNNSGQLGNGTDTTTNLPGTLHARACRSYGWDGVAVGAPGRQQSHPDRNGCGLELRSGRRGVCDRLLIRSGLTQQWHPLDLGSLFHRLV